MMSQVIDDAQTAVTSLGGAIAGVVSDKIANYVIPQVGLGGSTMGLGDVGLRFIVRAATTSVVFGGVAYLLPNSAENIFFSIVFFAGNRALVRDAVTFGDLLTGGIFKTLQPPPKGMPGGGPAASAGCSCSH